MKTQRGLRALAASIQTLEHRRLLTNAPLPGEPTPTHGVACTCSGCCGPGLDQAFARNGADHAPSWYTPVRRISLDIGGDANPTFTTNAAGLPLLTSRADGQGLKLFLDFDGNGSNLPFGIDADNATFNAQEQLAIYDTWRDIVSYFGMFNVNVTTIQPATGGTPFAWHLTSKSISGGYAFVNSLTTSGPTGFNEAGDAVSRHSGIAHEFGHILGLSHQGEWDKLGVNVTEYTDGFGVRDVAIMGVDFGTNVRNWIYGRTSNGSSSLQDDIAVIASRIASVVGGDGFRPDDFGNTTATAHVIPANVQHIDAVLERRNDLDVFQFTVPSAGPWHIDATPTYESSAAPRIQLLDEAGNIIAARDDADQRNGRNNDVEFTINLAPGTYYVRVASSADYAEFGEYLLTAGPLMTGFVSADVSTTIDRGGTASFDPATGILTQLGTGSDIWNTSDQFRFTHDTLVGDGSITTRVLSIDNTDANAKAGIMFRSSTINTSAFVMLSVKPGGQIELIRRNSTSASASTIASATPFTGPVWLRLTRTGTSYVGAYSPDGVTWTTLGSTTANLAANTLAGFATTSRSARRAAYAQFDQITLEGTRGEPAPTYNALPAPASLNAVVSSVASTSVQLQWSAVAGASQYHLERSIDGVNYTRIATPTATSYTDTLTFGAMRWWYRVAAATSSTSAGVPSAGVSIVNRPAAPVAPSSGYAVPAISTPSGTAIYINWSDVQGDEGYRVERSTDGSTFTVLGTTPANFNAYNDTTAAANTGYLYRVTPLSSIGQGASYTFEAGTRWTTSGFRTVARTATSLSLSWNDFANETGYRIERTTNGVTGWTSVATLAANITSWTNTGLTQLSEYYYRVVADLPLGEILSSTISFAATLPSTPLTGGWSSVDIGNVGGWGVGGSSNGGSTNKVVGGGTQIGSSADSMHYLYRPLSGDGSITVRLDSQKNNDIDDNAEAGIMIRESLAANARYAFVNVEPGRFGRTDFEYRTVNGSGAANVTGPELRAPIWMRLTRAGSTFTAEYSSNGTTWTLIGSQSIAMATPVYIGMAASAIESNLMSFATFSNVAITGNTSANEKPFILSPAAAGSTVVTGTNTTLGVTANDDAGEAGLIYTWTAPSVPSGKPAPVFGSNNGTNAAKSIGVTFGGAGFYTLRVTATDAGGLVAVSDVTVNVVAIATTLTLSTVTPVVSPGAQQAFAATGTDQFGDPLTLGSVNWSASAGLIGSSGLFTAPANAGPVTITATVGAATSSTTALVALVALPSTFNLAAAPHSISVPFNGDVSASLTAGDFVLTNTTTAQVIPTDQLAVSWNAANRTATVTYLPGVLPNGQYTLAAATTDINLPSGQTLAAPLAYDFSFTLGDVDVDGTVDFDDLLTLAQFYGQSGRNYYYGDLNYDGSIGFDDLLLMAQAYPVSTVAAPAPRPAARRRGELA